MSLLSITDVEVVEPYANFKDKLHFKIRFNCMEELPGELEWNLIYVGSPESAQYDQIVDTVSIGPIPPGNHEFDFESTNEIDPSRIQEGHLLGSTVLILNATYNDQEFVRVGYYVAVAYEQQELNENPPENVDFSLLKRGVLASEPRVTRYKINWSNQGEKYSISDQAMESHSNAVAAGLTEQQLMTGQDENVPPADLLVNASQNSMIANRMEAILAGMNDNSCSGGGVGGNSNGSFKAQGLGSFSNSNENSCSADGQMA